MLNNKPFFIRVDGQSIPVSKEIYLAYYQSKRRDRYYEHNIKIETAIRDADGNVTGYAPSKEDSLERLSSLGEDFADDGEPTEDTVVRLLMSDKLHTVLNLLTGEERAIIDALFFSNGGNGMTERECAKTQGVLQQTLHARKRVILAKLKKLLE